MSAQVNRPLSTQMALSEEPLRQLSDAAYALIDKELQKYPADQKQSAVMSALRIAQTECGFLTPAIEADIADYLGMAPIAVHEVASFYTMYNNGLTGRFKIAICTNLPCALRNGNQAADYLKAQLGIDYGQTTADGLFTLKEGECMGACGDSPVVLVNNHRMCSWMSNDKIDSLLKELREQAKSAGPAGAKQSQKGAA